MSKLMYDPFTKKALLIDGKSRVELTMPELVYMINQLQSDVVAPFLPAPSRITTLQPQSETGEYRVTFGKYRDRKLKQIPRKDLTEYCQFLLR